LRSIRSHDLVEAVAFEPRCAAPFPQISRMHQQAAAATPIPPTKTQPTNEEGGALLGAAVSTNQRPMHGEETQSSPGRVGMPSNRSRRAASNPLNGGGIWPWEQRRGSQSASAGTRARTRLGLRLPSPCSFERAPLSPLLLLLLLLLLPATAGRVCAFERSLQQRQQQRLPGAALLAMPSKPMAQACVGMWGCRRACSAFEP
jgi:hypothetical protein